jgi:hypothetical protein
MEKRAPRFVVVIVKTALACLAAEDTVILGLRIRCISLHGKGSWSGVVRIVLTTSLEINARRLSAITSSGKARID